MKEVRQVGFQAIPPAPPVEPAAGSAEAYLQSSIPRLNHGHVCPDPEKGTTDECRICCEVPNEIRRWSLAREQHEVTVQHLSRKAEGLLIPEVVGRCNEARAAADQMSSLMSRQGRGSTALREGGRVRERTQATEPHTKSWATHL